MRLALRRRSTSTSASAVEMSANDGPMVPIILRPGEGERLRVAGNEAVFKAATRDTRGFLGLVDYTVAPGFTGPPLHMHQRMTDMFFVLEGNLTLTLGEESMSAGPGTFVLVPPRVPHTFSNPGSEPARYLSLVAPGGFEGFLKELADALEGDALDPRVAERIAAGYDIENV